MRCSLFVPALAAASLYLSASADASTGPVAAYGFEDGVGTIAGDSSIYGNTGTVVGGAPRAVGRFGSAIVFDGANDRVRIADAGTINLASGMTLEAWVRPAATNATRVVLVKERQTENSYGLFGSGPSTPSVTTATDGEVGTARAASALPTNTWSHVAATYDGTTVRLFVNGVQSAATTASSGPLIPGNGPLSIGGSGLASQWFNGLIDEVRVYDRPLTAPEIQTDMTTAVGPPATTAPGVPASEGGSWSGVQDWPLVAVHTSMLSNGKVVAWDAYGEAVNSEHVWDPETGGFELAPLGINLFCAGHALLPDGRLFVAGGHELDLIGLRDTELFNPLTASWTAGPDMARGRWYPTTTTLPDGRVLIISGDAITSAVNPFFVHPSVTIPEIYDPRTNAIKSLPSAERMIPLYPYTFVAPDGRVVDAGPDKTTRLLDTGSGQWSTLTSQSPITGGSAVMYRPGKILKTGTWTDTAGAASYELSGASTVLDLDQAVPSWRGVAPMKWARSFHTLTVLPDGNVLSLGGQSRFNPNSLADSPVLQPEIWDPAADRWSAMASSVRPRGYHNTSLLLPDGRILLAGSGRLQGSLMVNETNAEIFSPPYLHKGPRPTITSAPGSMAYGGTIDVETPDAARIAKVSLVRIGAVTHTFNMDQRWLQLNFRQNGGKLEIDAPTSPNLAPPGVYYVFLLDDAGVPSKAAILSIFPAPDTSAPSAVAGVTAIGATGRLTLNWNAATDNVAVTRYVIHRSQTSGFTPNESTRLATVTSGTSYVDAGTAPGTYHYRVIAEDQAGNAGPPSAQATGTILADAAPPSVAITAPAADSTVRGSVTVAATATDEVGVAGVQFRLDGVNLGAEDTSAPYGVTWGTTTAAPGPHTLTAVARDAAGNTAVSGIVAVNVDNSVPAGPLPVAAYSFDEGAGTVVNDVTGKGHTGTIREALWTTAGRNGKALQFDGINDWVSVADATDLRLTGAMTLEAWINPSKVDNWRTVMLKERTGDLAYALYSSGLNRPSAYLTAGDVTSGAAVPANTWTHLAATYDGTTIRLYVNGAQAASASRTNGLAGSAGALRIGGNGIWNEWFAGKLDDIRIYDRALTSSQIQADMDTPVGPPAAGDTTPPSVVQGVSTLNALGGVTVSWAAATDDVGVVRYALHRSATSGFTPGAATKIATVTSGTSYADSGLTPGVYYYRVVAEDQAGNGSVPSLEVEGRSLSDTTPPTTVGGVTTTNGLGRITVAWTASSDNVGVVRYVVHRSATSGFAPSAETRIAILMSGTSYVDTGLAPGAYYYRVVAEDQAGNGSTPSAEVNGTSLADTTAPTVALTAPVAGSTARGIVTVSASSSDDVGVAGVQFRLDGANLGAEDTTAPYSLAWDTTTASAGAHTLSAVARDGAANSAQTAGVGVIVDNSAPPAPAAVAEYSFEDGSGTTLSDRSGKGHAGTIREAVWTAAGHTGKALQFDGVNDWVTIADAADLRLNAAMTLEAWVYPSRVDDWRTVILKERTGDLAYALYGSGLNTPSVYLTTGSATGTPALPVNTWSHLAATYDGATVRLYVNGVQRATAARSNGLTASTGALRLGGNNVWGEWFAGRIDDVRIYDKALTEAQVQVDMGKPVS